MSKQSDFYNKDEIVIEKIKSKHIKDLTNKKFDRWNVVGFAGLNKDLKSTWWCYCDCNKEKYYILVGTELTRGKTKSCGCLVIEENISRSTLWRDAYKYNLDKKDIKRLHSIFKSMKERCYNLLSKDFPVYGGRGIKICDQWLLNIDEFVKWSVNNGYKSNLSIDRINVNGNYEPSNCRWISLNEQARNKTTTIYINYKGERRTLLSVLEENGIRNNYNVYRDRIVRSNWDIEKAMQEPIRTHLKKDSLNTLICYLKNNNIEKINIKEFCENNNINVNTFRGYMQNPSFVKILNQNGIYKRKFPSNR